MPGVKGTLLGLKINGAFVSCETSCDFNIDVEMINASSVTVGRWAEFVAGIRKWGINVAGNLLLESVGADAKTILQAIDSGLPVFLQFSTRASVGTQFVLSGAALPQNLGIGAAMQGKANWTASFQGTGPLATSFEDFSLLIDAMPAEADYPIIVNEDVE
jgi:predicted secreted protein